MARGKMKVTCEFCGSPIDSGDRLTFRKIVGWEQVRHAGGTNQIHLRKPLDVFSCYSCISRLKRGLDVDQGALF